MKKTLQDQYLLIKEGKGHKGVFLTEAKRQFPDLIPNSADVKLTAQILKDKNIISENIIGLQSINQMVPTKKESFETAFETFLKEAKKKEETDKAEAKTVSKSVEDKQEHAHDNTDEKNIDNVIFDQVMMGYYAELKDPKNADKTMEELKAIVLKNLSKDPIHYTKDGQFGIKGLGYTTDHPGLGTPKEAKGKYASSGYGNLNESMDEAYQMVNITTGNAKTGGKIFVPDFLPVSPLIIKRFGDHMVFDESKNILYISAILYNNLIKGYGDQPAIKKLIMDIPPMVKQVLNKTKNYGAPKMLSGYKFKQYFPLYGEVKIATEDKFNKDHTKKYYSKGNFLIQNLNKRLEEDMSINESKLRNVIRTIIREELNTQKPLNENVHKRLKEIDTEVQDEVTQSKLNKIMQEIEKRKAQLTMIDENEDLRELTDKSKIKALQKEIKLLEKAQAKLEKAGKGKKKEVLDEADEPSQEYLDAKANAEERYNSGEDIEAIIADYPQFKNELYQDIIGGFEGMDY